ncbi:MAG TPA: hypothetical protein VFG54_13225 [Prolixibacteraceae bacterium]|nr:hypothetical protein [Prolixibacteraceae bacterium]
MAQSKKGKVVQMLTPENYIRKKARSLPIFECLVASGWEESGLPTVVITRKHTNGNITACTYMVDLKCLGVKDSSYLFNVTPTQYREFKELIQQNIELTPVDYALAHNIVLAGVEYAADLGFKPFKDYESVTKFMLEEDTDEIELIEIECGQGGVPVYVQGPYEDDSKARKIIAQLEKAVGHNNFEVYLQEDDWDDMNAIYDDEFSDQTFEEKKDSFLTLSSSEKDMEEENRTPPIEIIDSMVSDFIDEDQCDLYYEQLYDELNIEVTDDEIPDEMLGVDPKKQAVAKEIKKHFYELFLLSHKNVKKAKKELELFRKEADDIPGVHLLELLILQKENNTEYEKKLQEYALLYPDYSMLQIIKASWQVIDLKERPDIPGYPLMKEKFFGHRNSIHSIEYTFFLTLNSYVVGLEMDINKIKVFMDVVYDLDLPEDMEEIMVANNTMQKIYYLLHYSKESKQ